MKRDLFRGKARPLYLYCRRERAKEERTHRAWVTVMARHEGHGDITHFGPLPGTLDHPGAFCPRCGWFSMATVWGEAA